MPTISGKYFEYPSNVERDPRLFMWFLTLVMVVMYAIALIEKTRAATTLAIDRFHWIDGWACYLTFVDRKNYSEPKVDLLSILLCKEFLDLLSAGWLVMKELFSQSLWHCSGKLLECWAYPGQQ